MIRNLKSGQYRLYSRKINPTMGKRHKLGTLPTRECRDARARRAVFQAPCKRLRLHGPPQREAANAEQISS
jgi:hypothetical protein